jgi:hypothetical protein
LHALRRLDADLGDRLGGRPWHARQRDAVLRPLGAGERRLDGAEVELQRVGEHRVGRSGVAPQALRLGIGLDQRDALGDRGRSLK